MQTVDREANALYFDLIAKFESLTGVPVVLNTSFPARRSLRLRQGFGGRVGEGGNENEPIVWKPEEALDCFHRTKMDALALGPFWLERPVADASQGEPAHRRRYGAGPDDGKPRPPISEAAAKLCRDPRVAR